ncbi:MAG: acetate--CoA ligase family protein [Deltaproteobacteria bacterium]|nr:acetate--CoA ligase family protein [Deltaproteobacteria bacterium]
MSTLKTLLQDGGRNLSEYESKKVLASYNIPVTNEMILSDAGDLKEAAAKIGYPMVLKACSSEIVHKTEKGLVQTGITNLNEAKSAYDFIIDGMKKTGGNVLAQEMIKGKRELVVGLVRDPQFGPCVMFGLGGIFTEVLEDVSFRVAPVSRSEALALMEDIRGKKILDSFRGMPPVDRDLLADLITAVGKIGLDHDMVQEIDINPLIISKGKPIAVDAAIILKQNLP